MFQVLQRAVESATSPQSVTQSDAKGERRDPGGPEIHLTLGRANVWVIPASNHPLACERQSNFSSVLSVERTLKKNNSWFVDVRDGFI